MLVSRYVTQIFFISPQLDRLLSPRKRRYGSYSSSDDNDSSSSLLFVNSKVISASLGRAGRRRHLASSSSSLATGGELPDPARITFKHLRTINVTSPECVYWDYLTDG